jgi:Arc/MetJ-type ribon-helix-helix transcriptional regulator
MLTLEASSYADFTQFLFTSAYKLGKIEAGFKSLEKVKNYTAIIMSIPKNIYLSPKEIEVLEEYVRTGGSLLIIGSQGGEYNNRTNINELTRKFGFEFIADEINDSVNYVNLQKRPLIADFKPHYITENIKKIVLSSSCSLGTIKIPKKEKNIKVEVLVRGGLNCWRKRFDGKDWIEEDCPKVPLLLTSEYYHGQVVSFGTLSIFSSLGREYGFSAFDNDIIIANILRWLTLDITAEGKVITIDIQRDLFHWADYIVKRKRWENFSDLINVSLKYFKDNYKTIIKELENKQQDRYQRTPTPKKVVKEKEEEKVIDLIPKRKKEDIDDIISAIEEITGEKYERSISGDEVIKDSPEKSKQVGELPEDLNTLTVKELKAYCNKNNINLPAKALKKDIIKIILYVLGND